MLSINPNKCFFVLSCARSGSTSLASILNLATNGVCAIEPAPNLNVETREIMEGRLDNPMHVLRQVIFPRIFEGFKQTEIYGEKSVTYGPFIPYLYEELGCRFVFIKRDGRDVVRSLIDWHNRKFGTIYRECADPGDLTASALSNSANLPVHLDTSDYSRPRPLRGEPIHEKWETLSRFEMCAYYWQRINNLYLDQLAELPGDAWITIDYTNSSVRYDIQRAVDFLGLKGISDKSIVDVLERRINSLSQRGVTGGTAFPHWSKWDDERSLRFNEIAATTMARLGYNVQNSRQDSSMAEQNEKSSYGTFWKEHDGGHEWYTWMYNHRILQHRAFQKWFQLMSCIEPIDSVADFGSGTGVGYTEYFKDIHFVGIDLAPQLIDWCQKNYNNPRHKFICRDFIKAPLEKEFDLVFSQGTIDNVYDMDAFLRAAVQSSRKWIYITAYRGFFPELKKHRYEFNSEQCVYYNDISPYAAYTTLRDLGCHDIAIYASPTECEDIMFETVIVAHV